MPRNIRYFAWLWVISFLMQIPGVFLLPPNAVAAKLGIARAAELKLTMAGGLLLFAVLLPFLQLAVWKRKNWARWLLFVVFIICLPILFVDHAFRPDRMPMTAIGFASQIVEAAAFYFAFTGDARPWFRPGNSMSHYPKTGDLQEGRSGLQPIHPRFKGISATRKSRSRP